MHLALSAHKNEMANRTQKNAVSLLCFQREREGL